MRKGIHHLRCAVGSKVSIKQKWHANEQKPARNPGTDAASIISASRKWFSLPGSCPEDNNWPRERENARRTYGAGYYPTDAPGAASRRTAKAALGIIPEISGGAIRGAARSFRSHSPRDRRRESRGDISTGAPNAP